MFDYQIASHKIYASLIVLLGQGSGSSQTLFKRPTIERKASIGATMWLVKFAILVVVLACAVVGEEKCIYSLDIKHDSGHERRSPQISLVNPPNTECSYRIKAPFAHRIRVSCELSQKGRVC